MNAPGVYLESSPGSLQLLAGGAGLEAPLERLANGRLAPLGREKLTATVREFLHKQGVRAGTRAYCAIGARGVSLRRLTLPVASGEELERLLLLQIEREFPLSPDELAWGYRTLRSDSRPGNDSGKTQELLVVAVKKEALQEFADLFSDCGLTPLFTLAALARVALISDPPPSHALLDLGRHHSELITYENGVPGSIRVLPWGEEKIAGAGEAELALLAKSFPASLPGRTLYLSGAGANRNGLVPQLSKIVGPGRECVVLEMESGAGRSAAIRGLQESEDGAPPLILELKKSNGVEIDAQPATWKWAALACVLLLASFSLRYAEAFIQKPRLARKISDLKEYRDKLPNVERELSFLQYLKTNQPPYLEALQVMANGAPPGSRLETISMNRRGDLALRASLRDSQQVADFRSKLIGSGLFATVTVDEQTPTPDRQKITVRMTGQWKPSGDRKPAASGASAPGPAKPITAIQKTNVPATTNVGTPAPSAVSNAIPNKATPQ